MKKRMISFILVIIMLFSVFTPVYASNSEYKQPISAYGDEMLEYLLTDNHKLLVIRDNYGYMQFADKFRQNAASLFLLEMTDLLIQTGMEPDKSKYIEVLINIMGTYELDNATDISTQKSMDNLKSVQDYAMDIVDIGTKAVSFMVANNPEVSEFEEAISTAIGRMSTLKDDINNWVEALSNLETIVEDYSKYDDFLELIEQKSTGELKEAASTLRSGMRKAFTIKLDTYGEVSDDNFDNFSELFFSDIFWKVLKQTEDYEKDETLKEVVDAGDSFVSKIEDLINSWELALGIGKLVGNVTVGAENLVNRVLEIFALSDISAILQLEVTELSIDFFEKIGTQEEAKNWYETKADKILDIQKELLKVKNNKIDYTEIVTSAYNNFIIQGDYNKYTESWETPAKEYGMLDINNDGVLELFINSEYMMEEWSNTLIFTYNINESKVVFVSDIYHYGDIDYSKICNAMYCTDERPSAIWWVENFYKLENYELELAFSVQHGEDETEEYYVYIMGELTKKISESEYSNFLSDVAYIDYIDLPKQKIENDNIEASKGMKRDEICKIVENYYNTLYNTNIYVVFESESVKTENGYFLVLRSQGGTEANILVSVISVNLNNGEVSDEMNNNWNLYEYIEKNNSLQ